MIVDGIQIEDKNVLALNSKNITLSARPGVMTVNRFSPIGRSMMFYGEHGENELLLIRAFLEPGAVVFDVGAHQGTHAIPLALHVAPEGSVHAFEPQRIMCLNLSSSVALNGLENVFPNNLAVGAEPSTVRIAQFDYAARGHFSGMQIKAENSGEAVKQVALDEYMKEREIDRLDFIKIDVEGMEFAVLRGAEQAIEQHKPVIYMESHANSNSEKLIWLKERGYELFVHSPLGFNADNFYGYDEDRFNGGRDHNVICIPQEKLSAVPQEIKEILLERLT